MIFEAIPWWSWSILLFGFTTILGVVAVVAGVGGGVLYVPIVSALFPFHLDFVRGAGLMIALTGALSAGPQLLRSGLASLRLALPLALFGSIGSIGGALVGLALPEQTVKLLLGAAIFGIVVIMAISKSRETVLPEQADRLAKRLSIQGSYLDRDTNSNVDWSIRNTPLGFAIFLAIGFLSGMFGLGAGWANVPTLHLLLAAPLKVAVATGGLILTVNPAAAAWVYLHSGAVLPLIAIPSILGMMIGTRIGAKLLTTVKTGYIKIAVILILLIAAIRQILDGVGVLG